MVGGPHSSALYNDGSNARREQPLYLTYFPPGLPLNVAPLTYFPANGFSPRTKARPAFRPITEQFHEAIDQ